MTTLSKRLCILFIVFAVGLGSVYLLPTGLHTPEPGVNMELPLFIDDWVGRDVSVSKAEQDALGMETQFSRKSYTNAKGDEIYVSIVLSGQDMNTSIHRPERCLPAQGYTMVSSSDRVIPTEDPLTVRRLHNKRMLPLRSGGEIAEYSLDYYWFVSSSETTNDHIERNFIDVRDRVLKGYAQPWAFVTVISRISEGLVPFGRNEQQTDEMLDQFIRKLVPIIQKETVRNR